MIRTLAIVAALVIAAPAFAQGAPAASPAAPAQTWTVMSDHTLDMPSQGAHSRSRPWLKAAAAPAKKGARARRSG